MQKKKFSGSISGKGYYIALGLCAVAIGISGFLYYRNAENPNNSLQADPTVVNPQNNDQAVVATDNAAITDTFDPVLTALAVTFEGATWTQNVQYNYDEATGLFTTVPGQLLVPAASYTQDPVTGEYFVTPGIATLVVTGTI